MLRVTFGLAMLGLVGAGPAIAQDASMIVQQAVANGDFGGGIEDLQPLAETENAAQFGLGALMAGNALQEFSRGLVRHGATVPPTDVFAMMIEGGAEGSEGPQEPAEPIDYQKFRALLQDLVDDLDEARSVLVDAGGGEEFVVPVDVFSIHFDLDGDGTADADASLGGLFEGGLASTGGTMAGADAKTMEKLGETAELVVGFDRADAYWLAGYTQVVAAHADWLLAHDFEQLFNVYFHRVFPQAGLPMTEHSGVGTLFGGPQSDALIADMVAAVHSFNFAVTDRERLAGVLERLKSVTAFSRQNWDAILAETDDDRELVPSPTQTPLAGGPAVTEEVVAAWMDTLDTIDRLLAGDLLLPHWRFARGIDITAYFETATHTDLVMLITGYDALAYLADGPIASAEDFQSGNEVFGDDFPLFALWFN
ncbi:hypothetical protein GCM10007989_08300 [Devosia pacifica]|uniref:Uncharacterized protein n=1 Tax=Devosia pacifica TaxID=1335967 RepID=A0A918S0I0_9HYPH|nr:hypothetical protein [Devosia pacifica]GHA15817.1 hypothetical protein GCM10007989_08300 [Devosia pacifica]